MNKQGANGIEWTRVYGRPGYTWNPITGCAHACEWEMPDGTVAECYAKEITEKFGRGVFSQVVFQPTRVNEPCKVHDPSGIFCCSMSDLMGLGVSDVQIDTVLSVMRQTPQHIYFILTKNAPRLLQFDFPPNVWVGASVPPTFYMGKRLSQDQQLRMLNRTLDVLRQVNVPVRWMSIEPLSFDIAPYMRDCGLQWVVIGAASNGRKYYQPERAWVQNLLDVMDEQDIPVFFKGNLDWQPWRAFFPGDVAIPNVEPVQLSMWGEP